VLLDRPAEELSRHVPCNIVEGIKRMRDGKVKIVPGHDGVFGKISLLGNEEPQEALASEQMSLF
jgi:PHP family Zn ribbon phosphoesterase